MHKIENTSTGKIFDILKNSKSILICIHVNPDGDAAGSALALYNWSKFYGKEAYILSPGELPENIKFLHNSGKIEVYEPDKHKSLFSAVETIVIADLNDSSRLKEMQEPLERSDSQKILIDHHIEPQNIADSYYSDTAASSTGELIFKILEKDINFKVIPHIADCLYTAIMMDTGGFRFPATDAEVFGILAILTEMGANPALLYDTVYNTNTITQIRLLGTAYLNAELHYDGRFVLMKITASDFAKFDARQGDIEDFAEKLLCFKGAAAGALVSQFSERDDIRISFRSKSNVKIRSIAVSFGGGGHEQAAGARIKNSSLEDVCGRIIDKAGEIFTGL